MRQHLAIDLGAESGRGILARYDGSHLSLEEIGRFATGQGQQDVFPDGVRRWDFERIWTEIESLVEEAQRRAGRLDGIGVDSWGVDFGLLDEAGQLLEPPVHYRDASHSHAMESMIHRMSREEIWDATGIQFMPFNTLYQLLARQERDPGLLERARHLLMIPDLIHNRLTEGASLAVEFTNASTTQMLEPTSRQWHTPLLDLLQIPHHFLGNLVEAGSLLGQTRHGVPVYAPATHDTASAVVAVPAQPDSTWAFLSSGTWSLLGAELSAPVLDRRALKMGLSNEGGIAGTTRLLTNIMGLWLVQECRRSMREKEGRETSYEELALLAEAAPAGGPIVNACDQRFIAPADMPEEIRWACRETDQTPPSDVGVLMRCCYESLAAAYRHTLRDLEHLLGKRFDAIHIVGGGARNRVLNQWTADACGVPVVAGPAEATAAGNVLAQLVGSGALATWEDARSLARDAFAVETFYPRENVPSTQEDS